MAFFAICLSGGVGIFGACGERRLSGTVGLASPATHQHTGRRAGGVGESHTHGSSVGWVKLCLGAFPAPAIAWLPKCTWFWYVRSKVLVFSGSRHSCRRPSLPFLPSSATGRLRLSGDGGNVQVRDRDDKIVGCAEGLFDMKLMQRPADSAFVVESSHSSKLVSPKTVEVSVVYLQLKVAAARIKLKAFDLRCCSSTLWWEALLGQGLGSRCEALQLKHDADHWRRWRDAVAPFLPQDRALHRRADPRSSDPNYMRCLPEATVSTHAVLLLTLWRTAAARGESSRGGGGMEFLHGVVEHFFGDEDIELQLNLAMDVKVQMGAIHSGASTTIPIDKGQVYLSHFVQALDEVVQEKLQHSMATLDFQVDPDCGTMRFADFLATVYHLGIGSVIAQVVGQTAGFIESLALDKGFTEDAIQVEEDEPSLPKHARHDRGLTDQLAMGQGLALEENPHWQLGAFIRVYHTVAQSGKRMRVVPPKQLNESIMLRQLQAASAVLMEARHLSVAIDGTRPGKKDVNFLAVGGIAPEDGFRITWAPIQVASLWSPGGGSGQTQAPRARPTFPDRRGASNFCLAAHV